MNDKIRKLADEKSELVQTHSLKLKELSIEKNCLEQDLLKKSDLVYETNNKLQYQTNL